MSIDFWYWCRNLERAVYWLAFSKVLGLQGWEEISGLLEWLRWFGEKWRRWRQLRQKEVTSKMHFKSNLKLRKVCPHGCSLRLLSLLWGCYGLLFFSTHLTTYTPFFPPLLPLSLGPSHAPLPLPYFLLSPLLSLSSFLFLTLSWIWQGLLRH